jgi:large subunit ribosomal protein L44
MVYGHRRLLSTISKTVAVPKHRSLPPPEAKRGPTVFDPEEWVLRQPPPPTALQAFAHRIGLSDSLADPAVIQQVCIHPSFVPVHQVRYPNEPTPPSNSALASLGNALLGLFATEYIHATFPHLPTRVLKAVISAYVGPLTCASVAQEIGASHLLRWDRAVSQFQLPSVILSLTISLTSLTIQHELPSFIQMPYRLSRER